ncbi:tautomerase family protein [Paenibacillus sp. 8b26]|uniref:tautomerase family protein n=1 Tax=Paenibacillus sp. 8b26 TaxID=3424133 RepID=UPI003D64C9C8
MPLVHFNLIEGRDKESIKRLLDVSHEAIVEAFDVPQRDRYQVVHEHSSYQMVIEDTGLGINRSNNLVVLTIISKARANEKKEKLYSLLAERLEQHCGISPEDVIVSIVENGDADWSFGLGEAQFLNGKL